MTPTQRGTLTAAILGSSIVFLDATIVYIALPRIGATVPATVVGTLEGQTYVASAYLATLAAFLILGGALGDFHGRRRVFLAGLLGFGVTSTLCGVAANLELLILSRILQGVAGALLVPGSLSIITAEFEGPARARAFGLWAATTSTIVVVGPPLGGILVETAGWRAVFLVNVPLVAIAALATWRWMPESRDPAATGRFDWLGAIVGAIAVGGLAFGAIRGQERQWGDPSAFAAIAIGALATVTFPILMTVRRNPLVPLDLFRIRTFAAINLATLLVYGALNANAFFQSLFLQNALGYSPLGAAIVALPTGVLLALLSTRVGAAAGRRGARPFLVVGPALMAVSLLWWLRIPASSAPWPASLADLGSLSPPVSTLVDVLPATIGFGLGMALIVTPLTTTLMGSIPIGKAGVGSAINNALSRVGQPLVSAAVFIVVSGAFYATLAAATPGIDPSSPELRSAFQPLNPPPPDAAPALVATAREASTEAFRFAVVVMVALCAAGAAVSAVGLSRHEVARAGG